MCPMTPTDDWAEPPRRSAWLPAPPPPAGEDDLDEEYAGEVDEAEDEDGTGGDDAAWVEADEGDEADETEADEEPTAGPVAVVLDDEDFEVPVDQFGGSGPVAAEDVEELAEVEVEDDIEDEPEDDAVPGPDDDRLPPAPRLRRSGLVLPEPVPPAPEVPAAAAVALPGVPLRERRAQLSPRAGLVAALLLAVAGGGVIAWAVVNGGDDKPPRAGLPPVPGATSRSPEPGPATSAPASPTAEPSPEPSSPATTPAPRPTRTRTTNPKPTPDQTTNPPASPSPVAVPAYREPTKGAPTLVSCTRSVSNGDTVYTVKWKIVFTGGVYDTPTSGYGPQREIRHGEAYTWSFAATTQDSTSSTSITYKGADWPPLRWYNPGSTTINHVWQPPDFTVQKSSCT